MCKLIRNIRKESISNRLDDISINSSKICIFILKKIFAVNRNSNTKSDSLFFENFTPR